MKRTTWSWRICCRYGDNRWIIYIVALSPSCFKAGCGFKVEWLLFWIFINGSLPFSQPASIIVFSCFWHLLVMIIRDTQRDFRPSLPSHFFHEGTWNIPCSHKISPWSRNINGSTRAFVLSTLNKKWAFVLPLS